jgi:hypothetical protein
MMDSAFWEQLSNLDPDSVCRRSGAVREEDGYRLKVLDTDYVVLPKDGRIISSCASESDPVVASDGLALVIVCYLLGARDIPLAGEWVALKELGRFFISHAPNLDPLLDLFTLSPETVQQIIQTVGGQLLAYGDFAAALQVLPRLPLAFVFWEADEEFSARVSVLVDRTATQHLSLDVLSAAVRETTRRLEAVAC